MPYNYGIKNRYVPTNLIRNAYGWNGSQARPSEVPTHLMPTPTGMTSAEFRQQFAYEWVQSGESTLGFTNPPFTSGAAGRLLPGDPVSTVVRPVSSVATSVVERSRSARPESKARLYFMYNPEIDHQGLRVIPGSDGARPLQHHVPVEQPRGPAIDPRLQLQPLLRPAGRGDRRRSPRCLRGLPVLRPGRPQRRA